MGKAKHYLIQGKVQGVGYRNYTLKWANRLQIFGWVRNLDDGRVEALAQGNTEQLVEFEKALNRGPLLSKVIEVKNAEIMLESDYKQFDVIQNGSKIWSKK